jgi:transcription antitermination factor NusG
MWRLIMKDRDMMKIKNINGVAKHIGKDIATEMMIPIREMKHFIKPKEIASIIKQYSVFNDGEYFMNTVILEKVFTEVKNWVLGIQLAKMASEGKLDTIWDEEQNCMIFKSN